MVCRRMWSEIAFAGYCCALSLLALPGPASAGAPLTNEPITPVPAAVDASDERARLGDSLFHDPRLSADDSISCASCHVLALGGADGRAVSFGLGGAKGDINSPTVFNSALNLAQFWDGRAPSLEAQVDEPVHSRVEMASTWEQVLGKLQTDKALVAQFARAYPDGLTVANIRDAIASFERTLNTPGSPFDRYLMGDEQALTPAARRGYLLFKNYGCASCHQGAAVGGNMYQQMGAMGDYFADRGGAVTKADLGRYNATGAEEDRHVFKVPSLRLATLTAPYFHDGSVATLDEAIDVMARYQLGRSIPAEQRRDMIAFLESLVGTHPRLSPRH